MFTKSLVTDCVEAQCAYIIYPAPPPAVTYTCGCIIHLATSVRKVIRLPAKNVTCKNQPEFHVK